MWTILRWWDLQEAWIQTCRCSSLSSHHHRWRESTRPTSWWMVTVTVCINSGKRPAGCPDCASSSILDIHYPWWHHQMETFSALLAIGVGNSPVIGEFPTQRPVTQCFDVFFDLCLNKGWVNNRGAGDLRCHCAHYDVNVMPACYSQRLGFLQKFLL